MSAPAAFLGDDRKPNRILENCTIKSKVAHAKVNKTPAENQEDQPAELLCRCDVYNDGSESPRRQAKTPHRLGFFESLRHRCVGLRVAWNWSSRTDFFMSISQMLAALESAFDGVPQVQASQVRELRLAFADQLD